MCAHREQVRVYEKARDDYAQRFDDAYLPEACVADMLRGRAVCREGGQQLALQELLGESFEIRVEGQGDNLKEVDTGGDLVTLKLVRTKNKCSLEAVGAHNVDSSRSPQSTRFAREWPSVAR